MPPASKRRTLLTLRFLYQMGEIAVVMGRTLRDIFRPPFEGRIFVQQLESVGVNSMTVVALTAAFGGLVFGLQTYSGFHKYVGPGTEVYSGPIISVGLCKELIPLLVALMIAGRVGSSMTAELGTMKITEQIDALASLGADPSRYLVVPRTLAAVVMVPLLTLYGDMIGIFCGFFYNIVGMGVNRVVYIRNALLYFNFWDVSVGLVKAVVFGFVIATVGCWQGLKAEGGAEGVGRATTRSVVIASICVLILNFLLSKALPK
jgi:phospholipid/cholesterol/gamma-HCH transport system permease protein